MKTNEKKKHWITLVLSIALIFTVSVNSVAAAEPDDVFYDNADGIIAFELDKPLSETPFENPMVRSDIVLKPSTYRAYYIGTIAAGSPVTITVNWTPAAYDLYVGLAKVDSTTSKLSVARSGSVKLKATPTTTGNYYVVISNPSSVQALTLTTFSYSR